VVAALAAVLCAVAAAAVVGGAGGSSGSAEAQAPAGATDAGTVARRTLAERLTATGAIGYAGDATVLARLKGTVTALPKVGAVVRRGGRLYAVSGEPVILMYGAVPAYRTLREGVDEGPDVRQLERNLAALGYSPGPVDDDYDWQTAAAVRAWQEDLGLEASGEVKLGRVAFLRGPQRVTGAEARLGEALAGGSVPVLRTSSTRRVVAVDLEADQGAIARRGQKVRVLLPGGAEVPGVVRELTAVAGSTGKGEGGGGEGGAEEAGIEATVSLTGQHRIPALDGATVSVLFTQRVRKDVLSVPLTALIAIAGDRFAVFVRKGGARRQVVVTPGLAADGYAEVRGQGLRAGMTVETGG
jgi:membrane fusion protein, multidrug efflux system